MTADLPMESMAWKPLGDRAWWLELGDGTGGELLGRVRGMAEAVVAAAMVAAGQHGMQVGRLLGTGM